MIYAATQHSSTLGALVGAWHTASRGDLHLPYRLLMASNEGNVDLLMRSCPLLGGVTTAHGRC